MRPLRALAQNTSASWFLAETNPKAARKQWILGMKPRGTLTVDDGAVGALSRGKSLLPAGVQSVSGDFQRGDPVVIIDQEKNERAKGLVGYSSSEAAAIAGRNSKDILEILGYAGRAALVHRDDMVT